MTDDAQRAGAPALIGVVHLPPLPGSPRSAGALERAVAAAANDAEALAVAGFDGVIVENYGDVPFTRGRVEPVTVAAMTRCALAVRQAAPQLALGINVLRNDARAALAVAHCSDASFVRINVHVGARLTDQGIVEGDAYTTLRTREHWGAQDVMLFCDVGVKHSSALGQDSLLDEARDACDRGLADVLLLTGAATGAAVRDDDLAQLREQLSVPLYLASGVRADQLELAARADGVIVGSSLRASGKAGDPIDGERAKHFADAWRAARR
jgi:membrane complex biogenesis BtpA family protein